jgi:hypothetical protein
MGGGSTLRSIFLIFRNFNKNSAGISDDNSPRLVGISDDNNPRLVGISDDNNPRLVGISDDNNRKKFLHFFQCVADNQNRSVDGDKFHRYAFCLHDCKKFGHFKPRAIAVLKLNENLQRTWEVSKKKYCEPNQ